jgi:hypothetical protein
LLAFEYEGEGGGRMQLNAYVMYLYSICVCIDLRGSVCVRLKTEFCSPVYFLCMRVIFGCFEEMLPHFSSPKRGCGAVRCRHKRRRRRRCGR